MPYTAHASESAVPKLPDALTIVEAQQGRLPCLNLASTNLKSIPDEVSKLKSVVSLNVSDNAIKELPAKAENYPPRLNELDASANQLTALPACLPSLPHLQKLHAGVNSIERPDVVFSCPALQHAALPYNRISELPESLSLPPAASSSAPSALISLDLSHNNIADLAATLLKLQRLPMLRILGLAGNPVCLLPTYESAVKAALPQLKYFDQIKLDVLGGGANSRAGTAQQPSQGRHAPPSGSGVDTYLRVELSGLTPSEDPFKEARAAMEAAAAAEAAQAGDRPGTRDGKPGSKGGGGERPGTAERRAAGAMQELPLQPVRYHVELADCNGVEYGTTTLVIPPPAPPTVEPAAKESKQKAKPGGKADKAEPEPPPPTLQKGWMAVTLAVAADVAWRDWLRKGVQMKLVYTRHTAVAKPPPEGDAAADKPPLTPTGKAKGKGPGKGAEEPPPPPAFDVVTTQEVAGVATVRCASLVSGHAHTYEAVVEFIPVPALWDERGIRMAVDDPRHPTKPAGSVSVRMQLHAMPAGLVPP